MTYFSNIKPNLFSITYDENKVQVITLYRNIIESEELNCYVSECTSINIENQDDLEDYINENFDALFSQGLEKESDLTKVKESMK